MFPFNRPRRLRNSKNIRKLVRETNVHADQLVMPYFVQAGKNRKEKIDSMPGQFRFSPDALLKELEALAKSGVKSILLFGIPEKKDLKASGAFSDRGIVQMAVCAIKKEFPELTVITDVCLCAYMSHGHCGVLSERGNIDNDASLKILSQVALSHAEAGSDIIAPSDMMDGRVRAIRESLEQNYFENLPIMSYSVKYASAFYGPFRDAAHSSPQTGKKIPKDRKTYQMDPANLREAMREMKQDLKEGADILMVKPALAYLDVIREARNRFDAPLAAYLVSGEYSMIKAAAQKGWLDEKQAILEVTTSVVRAGADIVISYSAKDLADWLKSC